MDQQRRELLYHKFINESSQFIYNFVKDNNKTILNGDNEKYYMNYLKTIQNKIFNEKFQESMLYNIDDSLIFLNKLTINEFQVLLNNIIVPTKKEKLFSSIHELLNDHSNCILFDYHDDAQGQVTLPNNTKRLSINTIDIEIFNINKSNNSFGINSNDYTILPGNYTIEGLVENLNQLIELDGKIIYNKYINKLCFAFTKRSNLKLNRSLADLLGFSEHEYPDISKVISEKYNQFDVYKKCYIQIEVNDTKLDIYHTNNNLKWYSIKYPNTNHSVNKKYFDIPLTHASGTTVEFHVYNANFQELTPYYYNINCTFKCLT
jgi:hypothetical protein